jgi:hypothetical protein
VELGIGAVQGVRRPRESLMVANLSNKLKDYVAGVRRVKGLQNSVKVEGLLQGVRAKSSLFLRD